MGAVTPFAQALGFFLGGDGPCIACDEAAMKVGVTSTYSTIASVTAPTFTLPGQRTTIADCNPWS